MTSDDFTPDPEPDAWISLQPGTPTQALPLVCDSPHSGTRYPADFAHSVDRGVLRAAEDTHIERLWSAAPALGATLLQAHFPRSYLDTNRALTDLDATMFDAAWPTSADAPLAPSARTRDLGMGLVWRQTPSGQAIYDRRLSVAEVQRRIERCWRPYHAALQQACDQALQRWGCCYHLNLHSMPSNAYQRLGLPATRPLADFVLGDLHGSSCDPAFTDAVRRAIEARGYSVSVNDPYAGQELVRLHGQPAQRRHSLQVELNRALYMDEATREPAAGFEPLRRDIGHLLDDITGFVRAQAGA